MMRNGIWFRCGSIAGQSMAAVASVVFLAAFLGSLPANAQTETILYSFAGSPDGATPYGNLVRDPQGNLYGTTAYGNLDGSGHGTVFEITANGEETVLYNFKGGRDGSNPYGALIFDAAGNLYGTTISGGSGCNGGGCGTVFELSPRGQTWKETVLHRFAKDRDGDNPLSGPRQDAQGNLYGTTSDGGKCGKGLTRGGTIYELSPSKGQWSASILHTFCAANDLTRGDYGTLAMDSAGNLYGTAGLEAYELSNPTGQAWTYETIHDFTVGNGSGFSVGGVVLDNERNVYGVNAIGGQPRLGSVFELIAKEGWRLKVLHTFQGKAHRDGANPALAPTLDGSGNLFGTTHNGGSPGGVCGGECGVVYKLAPATGGDWTETVLYDFTNSTPEDGYNPIASVTLDDVGNLFGVTTKGGFSSAVRPCDCGVVYKIAQ
jgi:uncharacterized repeat protein (TIGR03803 family)